MPSGGTNLFETEPLIEEMRRDIETTSTPAHAQAAVAMACDIMHVMNRYTNYCEGTGIDATDAIIGSNIALALLVAMHNANCTPNRLHLARTIQVFCTLMIEDSIRIHDMIHQGAMPQAPVSQEVH